METNHPSFILLFSFFFSFFLKSEVRTVIHVKESKLCFIYYEQQIKRELKGINICGCRCNERLKAKTDGSTRLAYTGLRGELEHLTIETRLIDESFESVMGECVIWTPQVRRRRSG